MGQKEAQEDDLDVVPSGMALQQVSAWLGVDAAAVLAQETDPAMEAMFAKPHPTLLGLGAKHLSHKSMEASGLELKLKHKIKKSAETNEVEQYQPAMLDKHQPKRRKQEQQQLVKGPRSLQRQQHSSDESDSDEEGGKLGRPQQPAAAEAKHGSKPGSKVLDRKQLLQVPAENLSKWQRKRMREKAKKQQQQQQLH